MRFVHAAFLFLTIAALTGCLGEALPKGTLVGTVLREGTGAPIKYPVVVIARVLQTPLYPDQLGYGDENGVFTVTVTGGNYKLRFASSIKGPFFEWPEIVFVEPEKVTTRTFLLPSGY